MYASAIFREFHYKWGSVPLDYIGSLNGGSRF